MNMVLRKPKPAFFSSLRRRIVITMVVVSFLSAIFGGLIYQSLASVVITGAFEQIETTYEKDIITRIDNSALLPRQKTLLKEQTLKSLQDDRPFTTGATKLIQFIDRYFWLVTVVALMSAMIAFILGWLITRRIVRPLEQLRRVSQAIAGGDFSQRVQVSGDDEVGQVAATFNFMAAQLDDAEAKRRRLLGDVAHELKTPLASIQGHIEALRDKLPRATANPQAIYDIVLEDVAELDRMVGSLRTWLNVQGLLENLQPQLLRLAQELPRLLERFDPKARSASIKLEFFLDKNTPPVLADHNALRHMLSNLLDNALRYTPSGGKVGLTAWPGNGERPQAGPVKFVTLAVTDTGQGIAPEHWPHLFERFYRVDQSRTRDSGGTGLGLAIVKALAEAQGGRVWVNSRVGQGTTFFISLPVAKG